jgi:hypothetical protein
MQRLIIFIVLSLIVLIVGFLFFGLYFICGCSVQSERHKELMTEIAQTNFYVETAINNTLTARTLTATARGTSLSSIEGTARAQATIRAITATHKAAAELP